MSELRAAFLELLAVVEGRTPDQLGLQPWFAVQLRDRCRNALAMEAAKPMRREAGSARKGDSATAKPERPKDSPHE